MTLWCKRHFYTNWGPESLLGGFKSKRWLQNTVPTGTRFKSLPTPQRYCASLYPTVRKMLPHRRVFTKWKSAPNPFCITAYLALQCLPGTQRTMGKAAQGQAKHSAPRRGPGHWNTQWAPRTRGSHTEWKQRTQTTDNLLSTVSFHPAMVYTSMSS